MEGATEAVEFAEEAVEGSHFLVRLSGFMDG